VSLFGLVEISAIYRKSDHVIFIFPFVCWPHKDVLVRLFYDAVSSFEFYVLLIEGLIKCDEIIICDFYQRCWNCCFRKKWTELTELMFCKNCLTRNVAFYLNISWKIYKKIGTTRPCTVDAEHFKSGFVLWFLSVIWHHYVDLFNLIDEKAYQQVWVLLD
jgi:hypothetical protein